VGGLLSSPGPRGGRGLPGKSRGDWSGFVSVVLSPRAFRGFQFFFSWRAPIHEDRTGGGRGQTVQSTGWCAVELSSFSTEPDTPVDIGGAAPERGVPSLSVDSRLGQGEKNKPCASKPKGGWTGCVFDVRWGLEKLGATDGLRNASVGCAESEPPIVLGLQKVGDAGSDLARGRWGAGSGL